MLAKRPKYLIEITKSSRYQVFAISRVNCILLEAAIHRPEVFCKKGVLGNFVKFTGRHLCQSLFLNTGLRPATFLKKRL